ncbi:MAG: penicillin acylase family protein [Nibricoccus sp.]
MKRSTANRLRILAFAVCGLLAIVLALGYWFYSRVRASLPSLAGTVAVAGLQAPASIERDVQGVPVIRGANRADVARALGFAHGQDRFFQMDCTRRHAAGELAELFGKDALPHDRSVRLHGFRALAKKVLEQLPADQRALIDAYAAGVNAGLSSLKEKPFEYLLLRETPNPWLPEDCVLMIYAMGLDLQDEDAVHERSLSAVNDTLGKAAVAYFAPSIAPNDVALDGSTAPLAPMPTERMIDIRRRVYEYEEVKKQARAHDDNSVLPGSNAIALSGEHSASGSGLVANDMHLTLRLPNTWYRASLVFPHPDGSGELRITGVTIPGTPLIVAGSNGSIAWGFTNSYADTSDVVLLTAAVGADTYLDHHEPKLYEKRTETIRVRGGRDVTVDYFWTIWGPVIGKNSDKRDLALAWTFHNPAAANFNLLRLETARTVQDAIDIAHTAGIPAQNITVADSTGAIGWTICGFVPNRIGFDGRLPSFWEFGDRKWDGFLPAERVPVVISPANGRLWSGNQRMVGGDALRAIGDGGYERPARAERLRDRLAPLEKATPRDLLSVQLDVRAANLDKWQKLLVQVLSSADAAGKKGLGQMRAPVEQWNGQVSADSVGYRLVAAFRHHVIDRTLPVVFEPCSDVYPDFSFRHFNYEPALWDMIEKRPPHLLGQEYNTWDALLLAAAQDVFTEVKKEHSSVARAAWGDHNRADIHHPLARAFPGFLGRWLRAPADPLPGDNDVPRVLAPQKGASERFAVSPGHEAEGIFHMPGGQSGHPLSPYFLAGHEAWVKGEPTPFLPGPAAHTLTLKP